MNEHAKAYQQKMAELYATQTDFTYDVTIEISGKYTTQVSASSSDDAIDKTISCFVNDNPYIQYARIDSSRINSIS